IQFTDAISRKFKFPWKHCKTWKGVDELIQQAFLHIDGVSDQVKNHQYDLIGPDGENILPQIWEYSVKP
ncbi:hypothetical protein K470DRAFT_203550, partial [Piedraia hortae CBS 480.64]